MIVELYGGKLIKRKKALTEYVRAFFMPIKLKVNPLL